MIKEESDHKYTANYEMPNRTVWNDKFINKVLELIREGYSYKQISRFTDLAVSCIKTRLHRLREKPQWVGKIPYLKQTPRNIVQKEDRVGIIDIEFFSMNGVNANRGFLLCYSIKEYCKDVWYNNVIDLKDMKRKDIRDKIITEKCIKDICKFDVIIGYFSSGCDLPFLRTRAIHYDIPFPFYNTIKQIDLFDSIKYKRLMLLDRNSLKAATKVSNIIGKDNIDFDLWMDVVVSGDKKALTEIFRHNVRDVKITEKLYTKIKPYMTGITKPV